MQTAIWCERIHRDREHQITVSAYYGLQGAVFEWDGYMVLPAEDGHADEILAEHYRRTNADLLITLMDVWALPPAIIEGTNVAHWMPIDSSKLGTADANNLRASGATPIAMSKHGRQMLREAGFNALYVPHGIYTDAYKPHPNRDQIRKVMGIPEDVFIIGMCAANNDQVRKGYDEQFQAFAKFHHRHPKSRLLLHTLAKTPEGIDLPAMAADLGIGNVVIFNDQYEQKVGTVKPAMLAKWFSALDFYSGFSLAEGFGLPILEAQACGTPVGVTNAASMPELSACGWVADGTPFWNPVHRARWLRPNIHEITDIYEEAYDLWKTSTYEKMQQEAREFALQYDVEVVYEKYWKPVLADLVA